MAKANTVPAYTVSKDNDGYHFTVTDAFAKSAFQAAINLDALIQDVTPVAITLWTAYKKVVQQDQSIKKLPFFAAFDPSIAKLSYGKVGSAERKKLNSHVVLNRLVYLTMIIGRRAVEGTPVRDPQVAKDKAAQAVKVFGAWAKKFKIPANALEFLVKNIMGMQTKDEKELTKKGSTYLKEAGISVV